MSMTTPIVDFVRRYAQSGTSRLHMPGHKGQSLLGFEPWDITEIKGADELYGADGIIAQSEANATRLFGTVHTFTAQRARPSASVQCCALHCRLRPQPDSARSCWQRATLTKRCCMRRHCWILISSGSGLRRRMPVHFAAARCQLQS